MDSDIKFRLQVTDPTKLKKSILKDNEACEFDFSLQNDDSKEVTTNMLKQGKVQIVWEAHNFFWNLHRIFD